jgi:hypothetical protein
LRQEARQGKLEQNIDREEREKHDFFATNSHLLNHTPSNRTTTNLKIICDLDFWIRYCSWTYCPKCFLVIPEKLYPKFEKRPVMQGSRSGSCSQDRYVVPMASLILEPLLNLSFSNICTLRPIDLHCGNYERYKFGYRQKNGKCLLSWSNSSVEEKINKISDASERTKCLNAYNFLMKFERSSYASFVKKR